nr:EOG090X0FYD [Triops cancriformis]
MQKPEVVEVKEDGPDDTKDTAVPVKELGVDNQKFETQEVACNTEMLEFNVTEKEALVIGLVSVFLSIHRNGASLESIQSYLEPTHSLAESELVTVLLKYKHLFPKVESKYRFGSVEPSKPDVNADQLSELEQSDLSKLCRDFITYTNWLEDKLRNVHAGHSAALRDHEEKCRQIQNEAAKRESVLVMRLSSKEQDLQDLAAQITELKSSQSSGPNSLRSALLDPAVHCLVQKLRAEVEKSRSSLEETQNELSAWKFTPDSNTGKRLMAKCRLLYQENEELGKMIASGRLAKLEGDLALQRNFSEEMKKTQSELDEFLQELDEDVEGMQSSIYYLQQQLKHAREQVSSLQKENELLKTRLPANALAVEAQPARTESESQSRDLVKGSLPMEQVEPSTATSRTATPDRLHVDSEAESSEIVSMSTTEDKSRTKVSAASDELRTTADARVKPAENCLAVVKDNSNSLSPSVANTTSQSSVSLKELPEERTRKNGTMEHAANGTENVKHNGVEVTSRKRTASDLEDHVDHQSMGDEANEGVVAVERTSVIQSASVVALNETSDSELPLRKRVRTDKLPNGSDAEEIADNS